MTRIPASIPSLIETLHATPDGRIPLLARHLHRLQASASALGHPCPLPAIEQALREMAQRWSGQDNRLRLLLHADGRFELERQSLFIVEHIPLVRLAATRLHVPDPWLHHKSTRRPLYDRARTWLRAHPKYFDCLFLNQHDELCEGSRSNLYLRLNGQWLTPPLACGVLPGVMRGLLLESGQVREQVLSRQDLVSADGMRISNALHGWQEVRLAE